MIRIAVRETRATFTDRYDVVHSVYVAAGFRIPDSWTVPEEDVEAFSEGGGGGGGSDLPLSINEDGDLIVTGDAPPRQPLMRASDGTIHSDGESIYPLSDTYSQDGAPVAVPHATWTKIPFVRASSEGDPLLALDGWGSPTDPVFAATGIYSATGKVIVSPAGLTAGEALQVEVAFGDVSYDVTCRLNDTGPDGNIYLPVAIVARGQLNGSIGVSIFHNADTDGDAVVSVVMNLYLDRIG